MADICVPKSFTPYFLSVPLFSSCMAIVSAVCPPSPAKIPSGRSFSIILSTVSTLRGSRYTSLAIVLSVIMVAGLEFTSTTSTFSSFNTLHACAPA